MGKLLAHEIGHLLGVKHDGTDNPCKKDTSSNRLMTPTVAMDSTTWSHCSRKLAIQMVKNGGDSCLFD